MDYSSIAERAILDAPVLVCATPLLIQLDIALKEQEPSTERKHELEHLCSSVEYKHLVLLRDNLVQFKERNTTTAAALHNHRSEQELDLVAEKKWRLITHELTHCPPLLEHRYVLAMVRRRSSTEMLQLQRRNHGSTKRKKKYKFSLTRKTSKLEVGRQHWRNQSVGSTSSEESNGTTTTTTTSESEITGSMSPGILAHSPCELETLILMFRTKRDRRLWKDRLGISLGRSAIDTDQRASESPRTLPGRRFEHTLFQDMQNQGYLEPQSLPSMHIRSRSNVATAAGSSSKSSNVLRSSSSMSLLRAKTSTSLTNAKKPQSRQQLATAKNYNRHRSGISTKHLLAQRVNYQTTTNFTFGGEFSFEDSTPLSSSHSPPPTLPPARSKSLAVMKEFNKPLPVAPEFDKPEDQAENVLETVEERPVDESKEEEEPNEENAPIEKKEKSGLRHLRITDSVRLFNYRKSSTTSKSSKSKDVAAPPSRPQPQYKPERRTPPTARIATPTITHFEPMEPSTAEIVDSATDDIAESLRSSQSSMSLRRHDRKVVRFRSLESVIPTIPESPVIA